MYVFNKGNLLYIQCYELIIIWICKYAIHGKIKKVIAINGGERKIKKVIV